MSNWAALKANGLRSLPRAEKLVKDDLWFDDVDEEALHRSRVETQLVDTGRVLTLKDLFQLPRDERKAEAPGRYIGISVLSDGKEGVERVVCVNWHGRVLLDARPDSHAGGLTGLCAAVSRLIEGRIVIGHGLRRALSTLRIQHPHRQSRDTARYPFDSEAASLIASHAKAHHKAPVTPLGPLAVRILTLSTDIRGPLEEACAAMLLYRNAKAAWDARVSRGDRL